MARPATPLLKLHELKPGQHAEFFAFLSERSQQVTRDGKPYFACRFRDNRRTVACMVWDDAGWFDKCAGEWEQGRFYRLKAKYSEPPRYGPQIEIEEIRLVNDADRGQGFDPSDLVDGTRHNVEAMFAELQALAAAHIVDEPLRRLVLAILDRHAEQLKRCPATVRHFFPFPGGLLEHTLSVTKSCVFLAEKYAAYYTELQPPINKDLVVAGAILHDIGRVVEFGTDPVNVQPTVAGRFFGHLILGRDVVRDMARELGDVNPELVAMLEHIVLTHLSIPEWGSPRLPLVPECLIIHHADDMDAKIEMYARCLSKDTTPGPFTERDPVLNRHLYKGRSV